MFQRRPPPVTLKISKSARRMEDLEDMEDQATEEEEEEEEEEELLYPELSDAEV